MEKHLTIVFATVCWVASVSLQLFIFWPVVSILSILVGFALNRIVPGFNYRQVAANFGFAVIAFVGTIEVVRAFWSFDNLWLQSFYFVAMLELSAVYIGILLSITISRISKST